MRPSAINAYRKEIMNKFNGNGGRALLFAVMAAAVFASGAFAREIDASGAALVPIRVNFTPVDGLDAATVEAKFYDAAGRDFPPAVSTVKAGAEDTLRLAVNAGTAGVRGAAQGRRSSGAVVSNRAGKVSVRLPERSYKSAEVSLYTAGGKRVMRVASSASGASGGLSRRDVTAGVYILSVKGADGVAPAASRLTHTGGGMSINVAFAADGAPGARRLPKKASEPDDGGSGYTIKVSAPYQADTAFDIHPKAGMNERLVVNMRSAVVVPPDGGGGALVYEGQTYKTVVIGGVRWMAENLNYAPPSGVSRCYGDSPDSCAKYGRLYDWAAAQTVCPAGWRLPDTSDWSRLVAAAGGSSAADKKLRAKSGWRAGGNGTDDFGFSALPGGDYYCGIDYDLGYVQPAGFVRVGEHAFWWTPTEYNNDYAVRVMDAVVVKIYSNKTNGFSVRCIER